MENEDNMLWRENDELRLALFDIVDALWAIDEVREEVKGKSPDGIAQSVIRIIETLKSCDKKCVDNQTRTLLKIIDSLQETVAVFYSQSVTLNTNRLALADGVDIDDLRKEVAE